jgi:O-antigen biosynthesis protein
MSLLETHRPLVSVIVLTYNSERFIGNCLTSLAASKYKPFEVIVPDNASRDNTIGTASQVCSRLGLNARLILLARNEGCAGGNNRGAAHATGEVLVFLNPDTEVDPDFVGNLAAPLLADRSIGITGAKMFYPGRKMIQHAGGLVTPIGHTSHIGAHRLDDGSYDQQRDVDYVTGAGFAIRRELFEALEGLDEEYYPAYFEETDMCYRARAAGYRITYVPSAVLIHHESVSLGIDSESFVRMFMVMRIRYCIKNFPLKTMLFSFPIQELRWLATYGVQRRQVLATIRAYLLNIGFLARKLAGIGRTKRRKQIAAAQIALNQ